MSIENIVPNENLPKQDRPDSYEPMVIESASLSRFPFDRIKEAAAAYSCSGKPRSALEDERIICYNISDSLEIFPHLHLDNAFRLLLYVSMGNDGAFCTICALQMGNDPDPMNITPVGTPIRWTHPAQGVNPLEVVYRDGTPESFMEGVMFRDFLQNMTESVGLGTRVNEILTSAPPEFRKFKSGFDISVKDWTPRIVWNTVSLWRRRAAGAVNGRVMETVTMETTRYDSRRYYNEMMALLKLGRTGAFPNTTVNVMPDPNLNRSLVNFVGGMVVMEKE